jgi:hypothetical protein
MLKVSLHYATPAQVSAKNVLGRLDIGYAKLDLKADYKAVMFTTGVGEQAPVQLTDYPRWSASIWDLVSRVVCLSLGSKEAISPENLPFEKKPAFIDNLTAVIEHWPDGLDVRRSTIGTAHVQMRHRKGQYTAIFETDLQDPVRSSIFTHTPLGLSPWDLLARAYAWAINERFELPARPTLYTPITVAHGTASYVALETVSEPARTGIQRWLRKRCLEPSTVDVVTGPCVTEACFVEFLRKAV